MRIYLKHKAPFDQSPRAQLDHHSSDLDSEMQVCFPPRLREERRERGRKGGKKTGRDGEVDGRRGEGRRRERHREGKKSRWENPCFSAQKTHSLFLMNYLKRLIVVLSR